MAIAKWAAVQPVSPPVMQDQDSSSKPGPGKNASARVETAAINALPTQPLSRRPTTVLTPAVQRVIAWHQQRLSGRAHAPSSHG